MGLGSKIVEKYKREYNSERRRKLKSIPLITLSNLSIRENITPRGDGNKKYGMESLTKKEKIRENITPRGDGNPPQPNLSAF